MITAFAEIAIDRSAAEVFEFLISEKSRRQWVGWLGACDGDPSSRLAKGSRFDFRRNLTWWNFEITGLVANTWIGFEASGNPNLARLHGYVDLTTLAGGGRTRMQWVLSVRARSSAIEAVLPLFVHALSRRLETALRRLRNAVEAMPPRPRPVPSAALLRENPARRLREDVYRLLGRRIRSVLYASRDKTRHTQLFLVLDDGTHFEFYASGSPQITAANGPARGGETEIRGIAHDAELLQEFINRRSPNRPPSLSVN